ncbi:hypothetical protein CHRY9390_00248 [Chryseobacterium aquaeductus]|uniref:eCIS core domain-containing protein n=1 Tax=Chryseobacterium aquaeductus TaxID=2675056 RepID=A0A9N8QR44_9FLAO|nr:DUF4157 domain-containing protein [Chryseobacterium aquaeductus]CAA7329609.1 hypothetical protein CHRY9390_00248 [Chryseobacterium potabilaquae]CAD7797910.1 hypothetical protein CHRY9390_00248 [Chryseobacterium aquaeductus]
METLKSQNEKNPQPKKSESFFFKPFIQKKISVGSANDSYEKEADSVADKIVRMSDPPPQVTHTGSLLQRKCASCEEEEKLQMKPLAENITPFIQRFSPESDGVAPTHIENQINSTRGGGSVMESETKNMMESRFGADFSNVKIHTGSQAVQMSRELNAQAFAVGNDIYFNEGKYNPNSDSGKHLLAHELTHTIQQTGGIGRKIQRTCGDVAENWYNPFIRIASYDPGCMIQYANVNRSTITPINSDWQRNALNTGLFSAFAGVATTVIGRRLGLSQLAALVFGGAVGGIRGYVGMTAKERIRGFTVVMNNWYGRYKYNVITNEILAVDYQGKSNDVLSMVSPWYLEEAIFDAENNIIGNYIHTNEMDIPGVHITGVSLPENSFGTI